MIVGKDAIVIGAIIAEEAVIRGKITGLIRATRVLLQASARVESEIIYQSSSVDEGRQLQGYRASDRKPLRRGARGPWPNCEARETGRG